jgi:formate dehydrogenase major subunit
VGFQWVMEARARGGKVIHVDPRFTRTSAMADIWVPLRAGSDIALLGALIRYVIENGKDFREYILNYTNAPVLLRDDYQDSEDLGGVFSGWDEVKKEYKTDTWAYRSAPLRHREQSSNTGGGHAQDRGGEKSNDNIYETDMTLENPR